MCKAHQQSYMPRIISTAQCHPEWFLLCRAGEHKHKTTEANRSFVGSCRLSSLGASCTEIDRGFKSTSNGLECGALCQSPWQSFNNDLGLGAQNTHSICQAETVSKINSSFHHQELFQNKFAFQWLNIHEMRQFNSKKDLSNKDCM